MAVRLRRAAAELRISGRWPPQIAVDLLGGADAVTALENGVQMLPIDSIRPFRKHPFRLYEGDGLDDMVESIREHGVLVPVIVWQHSDGYDMLSGHNRQMAGKMAGLTEKDGGAVPDGKNRLHCGEGPVTAWEKLRKDVAEQTLVELVRMQAQLLVTAEQMLKEKKNKPKKGKDAGSMRAEIRRLEEAKVSDYESYKEGKLTREMFLERKKASDLRRQELSAAAAELEAQCCPAN